MIDTNIAFEELVQRAWNQHQQSRSSPWLVQPSAPVLFFGDPAGYLASPLRIITVALNPSNREFPAGDPFERFPFANDGSEAYIRSLSGYFTTQPYSSWFDFFDQALRGIDGSYYPGQWNLALHTDIGSCLPTSPTWSGLSPAVRAQLEREGVLLWHDLAEVLRPQVLLFSTARRWLDLIRFGPLSPWRTVGTFHETEAGAARVRPVCVEVRWYQVGGAPAMVAFVPAAQKPLASLSHPQKLAAGRYILEAWNNGLE